MSNDIKRHHPEMNMHRDTTLEAPRAPRSAALWLLVPAAAAVVGTVGLQLVDTLRDAHPAAAPELVVATLASSACLAVAGWWLGGLLLAALAGLAHRMHWRTLERWARRLTPGLVARTAGALVGAQLIALAPAHAEQTPIDPFWGTAATGTEQLAPPEADPAAPSAPAQAPDTTPPGSAGADAAAPVAPPAQHGPAGTTLLAPGALDGQAVSAGPGKSAVPAPQRLTDGSITVVSGDTLWDLTEQLLGPGATVEDICRDLGSWADHNVLSQHGNLIHPGDRLQVPAQLLDAAGRAR